MAECSQEFKSLLIKHAEECFDDWVFNIRSPECASAKGAILQYVAGMEAERDELRARLAEIERLRDALRFVVHEWESVPGGGMVHVNTIQRWLTNGMKPAIDKARDVLNAPQGGSNIEAANMTGGMP